jgi:hypothetical protein
MSAGVGDRRVGPKWASGTSCGHMAANQMGQITGFRVNGDSDARSHRCAIRRVKQGRTSSERVAGTTSRLTRLVQMTTESGG